MRCTLAALLASILGALGALGITAALEPSCPTEDSCQPIYQDGAWHVTEVTP